MQDNPQKKPVYLVIGNHDSFAGIYEIAHILNTVLSANHELVMSRGIRRNAINVLIDEFSSGILADYVLSVKREAPTTGIVLVATEFVTPVRLFGLPIELTFDLPSSFGNLWTNAFQHYWQRAAADPAGERHHMHARFRGFGKVVRAADLVVSLTTGVAESLALLGAQLNAPQTVLYPEFNLDHAVFAAALKGIPFGFVHIGALTDHRKAWVRKANSMFRTYRPAGGPAVKLLGTGPVTSANNGFSYPYKPPDVLYNFNPPPQRRRKFSSPIEIYRAVIMGQVPVVTEIFGDHEIESIAVRWNGTREDSDRLFLDGTLRRDSFIDSFLSGIKAYNEVARDQNLHFQDAFDRLIQGRAAMAKEPSSP